MNAPYLQIMAVSKNLKQPPRIACHSYQLFNYEDLFLQDHNTKEILVHV
jgi:hypothetical protein